MLAKLKKISTECLSGKLFPLLLIAVMACTYLIQLPKLGFYLDDWVSIAAYDQAGESGLIAFGLSDSRPFAAWVTAKFFALLGTGVLQWQLITLFWRFAAAMTCFGLLRSIWPERKNAAGFIAILFGVFPYFKHQAICIAYFMILMQYFVVLLSFYLTVKALLTQKQGLKILLFILSYAASLFHLACLEYYLSLEAARFIIIFIVLRKRDGTSFLKTLKKTFLIYVPYILILISILVYRFIYIPSLSQDIRPVSGFKKYKGIKLILHLIAMFLQYLTESVLGVWYRSINPSGIDLNVRNTQIGFGLGILAGTVIFILLQWNRRQKGDDSHTADWEMLVLGAAAMLLGYLPGIAIDTSPASSSNYQDRYLLPSFFGIAVFTIAFFTIALKSASLCNLFFSGMICIAVIFQIQNAYMYRYSWKYQQQFQWEMKWRVPDLERNTALIGDGVIASFMGGWADGSMLNEMYGKHDGINPTPYWYFNIGEDNYFTVLGTDDPIYVKTKMYEFQADSANVLVVTKPEYGKCFWVVDEIDAYNPYLEPGSNPYIRYQNKSRIITDSDHVMPEDIFGKDYVHNWCYYFEKGDLAFDCGDYSESIRLYEEAAGKGLKFGNPTEMRPFIKSAAFSGEWEKALSWSEMANSVAPDRTSKYFAQLWKVIARDVPDSPEKEAAVLQAKSMFASE